MSFGSRGDGFCFRIGYPVTYVGCVPVGERGDFRMIEGAIEQILASEQSGARRPVLLEFQDMNVKISSQTSSEVREILWEFPL